jgi:hypothetical protein
VKATGSGKGKGELSNSKKKKKPHEFSHQLRDCQLLKNVFAFHSYRAIKPYLIEHYQYNYGPEPSGSMKGRDNLQ